MKLTETEISDCFYISGFHQKDDRGEFVKIYNSETFREQAFDFMIEEMYFTISKPNVFRGFHYQEPPHDHTKLVFCNQGSVRDFVLDIRKNSKSYGKVLEFNLNDIDRNAVLIPRGCAHGFFVPEQESMLSYLVETGYNPEFDTGILWNTIEFEFDFDNPIISERDKKLKNFNTFNTPFK